MVKRMTNLPAPEKKKAEKAFASSAPVNPNQINYEKTIWVLVCLSE